jgi:hypothetical protein
MEDKWFPALSCVDAQLEQKAEDTDQLRGHASPELASARMLRNSLLGNQVIQPEPLAG